MKQFLIALVIVVVVVAGLMLMKKNPSAPQVQTTTPTEQVPAQQPVQEPAQPSTNTNTSVKATVTTMPKVENATVTIANFAFAPATVTVAAGGTVTWKQEDSAPHAILADDGSFKSNTLSSGQTYSHTFTKAGTYTYHCSIHPMMKGTIIVQ